MLKSEDIPALKQALGLREDAKPILPTSVMRPNVGNTPKVTANPPNGPEKEHSHRDEGRGDNDLFD